ncbi:hypothetical protein C2845_PM04G30420 [Panicum miliaceum]|uniref:Uncharacterized protein n=1 Tax=Panicum miliaceum TaxID=4540 RepID=A0A3L6QP23_PANMI|nr:hypothetical protein C2845_PM04G30420 [Panicum miliaceum]
MYDPVAIFRALRAEDDLVVGSGGAGEGACGVVLWVAVGVRALPLEVPRVVGRPAAVGRRADAAVHVLLEHGARVVARPVLPQLRGAPRVHVAAHRGPRPHPDPPSGRKLMGTLKPSMREMSKKSRLLNWFSANSASVLGARPYPVRQLPRPAASNWHPVRAQMRAAVVPAGTLMRHVSPRFSCRPPPAATEAAHTVKGHWFTGSPR